MKKHTKHRVAEVDVGALVAEPLTVAESEEIEEALEAPSQPLCAKCNAPVELYAEGLVPGTHLAVHHHERWQGTGQPFA
jgi:hypothetical protein